MFLYRKELNELIEHVVNTTKSDYFSHIPDLESRLHLKYLKISRLYALNEALSFKCVQHVTLNLHFAFNILPTGKCLRSSYLRKAELIFFWRVWSL